jgi:hypothetical protein
MADEQPAHFPSELVDKLKEYELLADRRDERLRKEAEEEAKRKKDADKQIKSAYDTSVEELSNLLTRTITEYQLPLSMILNRNKDHLLYLGTFTTERQGATTQSYNHEYGLSLHVEDGVRFYVDKIRNLDPKEFLSTVKCDLLIGQKLALTAEQYKKDLTSAVEKALGELKTAEETASRDQPGMPVE